YTPVASITTTNCSFSCFFIIPRIFLKPWGLLLTSGKVLNSLFKSKFSDPKDQERVAFATSIPITCFKGVIVIRVKCFIKSNLFHRLYSLLIRSLLIKDPGTVQALNKFKEGWYF